MFQSNPSQGLLILFEGGEKVGKSTQIIYAKRYLTFKGYSVIVSHEPGGGDPAIRTKLLAMDGNISFEEELDLFCEDRSLHIQSVIMPALQENKIILLDRFEPSTVAYQGYARGMSIDSIKKKSALARDGIWPDIIFLLDADPEHVLMREQATSRFDAEKIDFHKKVRVGFLKQAREDQDRWHIIDATQPIDRVWEHIKTRLDSIL